MSENVGRAAAGRGRGRARGEPTPAAAAPPGPTPAESSSDVGRRGAGGRRAEASGGTPPDKAQRGSPADSGSPPTEKMANLDLISLAARPGFGSSGRKYRFFTNHFEMKLQEKLLSVYRYQIEISHPKLKLTRDDNRPIFWKCLHENYAALGLDSPNELFKVAYDAMHCCHSLNEFRINTPDRMIRFEVEAVIARSDRVQKLTVLIQDVGPQLVDLRLTVAGPDQQRTLTPIQILDIIIRQYRSNPLQDFGRSFYPFRNSIFMIPGTEGAPGGFEVGGGREIWKGLFTSAHVGQNFRALVNMDVDHTLFYKNTTSNGNGGGGRYSAIEFLCAVLNEYEGGNKFNPAQLTATTTLNDAQCRVFEKEIKGLKVCIDYNKLNTTNPNREYRVLGVDKSSLDITFTDREGQVSNVATYFQNTYGALRFPRMPTLRVGNKQRPIHLPIEHCYVARNQKVVRKLTENQLATMIRQTCMPPADRQRSIETMVQLARFNEDPFLRNFGVEMSTQMLQVEGRILPNPALGYAQNAIQQPRDGVWRTNNTRFHLPAEIRGVAVVAFKLQQTPPPNTNDFIAQLMRCCTQYGMTVPPQDNLFFYMEENISAQRVEIAFNHLVNTFKKNEKPLDLVIALLPQKGHPLYADIKRVAEIQMGLMTQCVTYRTIGKVSPDTLSNIVYKINMKMGGINCVLKTQEAASKCLFAASTLILGIDVTHPGPTERRSPSIASVVGSMDNTHMRFAASIKVQKQRREHLVYLAEPVTERLLAFYRTTKEKPQRIIVYRDGVSEGEFRAVLHEELRGIREACTSIDQNFRPAITFIVVQKRHHTRFFPANPSDGCGKHKNVFPGTTLDTDILHHDDFNFYLCSHAGIQGTSRPTRYHVLHDDNKFKADEVQLMTYYLCHNFSRCTRAVSIPAPVYYAHLACARARHHLKNIVGDSLSDTASTRSGGDPNQGSSLREDELIRAAAVHEDLRKDMYFT